VLRHINKNARIIICGTASLSSWDPWPTGPRIERHLLVKTARMQGLLVFDYEQRTEEAVPVLAAWVREGKLRYREDILDGLDQAPGAIAGLYRGENLGKRLIKL
jgi:NADPH-dependent curcumin reductase CurA